MRCLLLVAPVYALVTPRTAMRSAARRNTARPVRMSMDTSIFESVRPMLADALDAVARVTLRFSLYFESFFLPSDKERATTHTTRRSARKILELISHVRAVFSLPLLASRGYI